MNLRTSARPFRTPRILAAIGSLAVAVALIAGCSSAVSPSISNPVTGATATVPVTITDAPSDQLVSFSLTLNSITLTDTAGKTASILSTPTTVEICHLNGIQAPLVTASIAQDTYVSALITFSNPAITYINSAGQAVVASPNLTTTSYTFTFPTPFTVSNSSTSLVVDLLAGQSVTITGTTVNVTPVFSLKPVPPATAGPPAGQNGTGMEQHGTVVSASATTLVLSPGSGANVSFTTNSATVYQGVSSLTALTAGELVEVDFTVQSGGTFLATRIQLLPVPPNATAANLLTGPVTSLVAGTGFDMTLMQGAGPSVGPTAAGATVAVTTSSSTTYAITPQFISLTGLPFTPTFTAANLVAGQTVGVVASAFSSTAGTATATTVYLVPQTINGTVTAIATVGSYTAYTYTLASGSAFASLSGANTLTVYTSTATAPPPGVTAPPAIAVGSTVRFNGLIFNLGGGKFAMIAGVCPDGAPGV